MLGLSSLAAACGLLAGLLLASPAVGQEVGAVPIPAPSAGGPSGWAADRAAAGPFAFLADTNRKIGRLDLSNGKVKLLGSAGASLTDIAFAPGGKLFGVSFTTFYRISTSNGRATAVGPLGPRDINALTCPTATRCLAYGVSGTTLYEVNTATGKARTLGSNGRFRSAGDLVFFEDKLFLSSTDRRIVRLDPANGAVLGTASHGITDLFGLVATGDGFFFGFSNTKAYRLNPTTGASLLLGDFGGQGLSRTNGAAFNGYFKG